MSLTVGQAVTLDKSTPGQSYQKANINILFVSRPLVQRGQEVIIDY